ncbi:hypothetical protein F5B21DRAFT_455434 [Xylaria acuta]|nr:hypothetical protein F5B21DRAFT_455434 [Xylaria acuta]
MELSIEAIVAIIALFVALPPVVVILARLFRRYRSRHVSQGEPTAELELESAPRTFTPSPQPSPLNPPWRTTSIRMVVEDCGQRHLFEVTRDRQYEEPIDPESNLPLLAGSQSAGHHSQ